METNSNKTRKKYRKKRFKKVDVSKLTRFSFLPSIFTLFNLLLGYLAFVQILNHQFLNACYFIAVSVIMDGFDGTVARLTKTESNFGVQLDSLVDAATFGFVTSIMVYVWGFQGIEPQSGKIIGFVFLSAGIIRLARFNVMKEVGVGNSNVFTGLPIPFASLAVLSVIILFENALKDKFHAILFGIYVVVVAVLMISNVKYRTIKKIQPKNGLPILFVLAIMVAMCIILPRKVIPVISIGYLVSPLFFMVINAFSSKKRKLKNYNESEPEPAKITEEN